MHPAMKAQKRYIAETRKNKGNILGGILLSDNQVLQMMEEEDAKVVSYGFVLSGGRILGVFLRNLAFANKDILDIQIEEEKLFWFLKMYRLTVEGQEKDIEWFNGRIEEYYNNK